MSKFRKQAILAVCSGNVKNLQICIDRWINLNKEYILHLACEMEHLDVVDFLIKRGADFIPDDDKENTPLRIAATSGNLELVKLLVKREHPSSS